MPFMTCLDIERHAITQLAERVFEQSGLQTEVGLSADEADIKVTLRAPKKTFMFKGTISEAYSYLVGWLHATKEDR